MVTAENSETHSTIRCTLKDVVATSQKGFPFTRTQTLHDEESSLKQINIPFPPVFAECLIILLGGGKMVLRFDCFSDGKYRSEKIRWFRRMEYHCIRKMQLRYQFQSAAY